MTIPTLGHPEIWPLLARRLTPSLKPRLGRTTFKPVGRPDTSASQRATPNASLETRR